MREYDLIAEWYAETRDLDVGIPDLDVFVRGLPPHARVLDLGCGHGLPIAQRLVQLGLEVDALDSSPEMVARFRANLPGVAVQCGRIQDAHVAPASFDAVVAWGVLFHLSAADQQCALEDVASWLVPGGRLLFTSGDLEGERTGEMDGVVVHYVSLGVDGYREALGHAGMRLVSHHKDAWENDAYVAEKPE
ncbi:class I SAM-dependent methyltransferase [Rubrivirga sp.]|uniref:class I SAM-dependent methyltransferase n=1 Tax=Rubrivirga sp. TaxID=1885344 RepID=UPI003C7321F6